MLNIRASQMNGFSNLAVVMARGRVAADGTPDELRQQTGEQNLEDAFVALTGEKIGEKQEAV
jgi:hypothetical protein